MKHESLPNVDEYLFGNGMKLDDYYIQQTPVSEVVCYRNAEGRDFYLHINNPDLDEAVTRRLKELGVSIIRLK